MTPKPTSSMREDLFLPFVSAFVIVQFLFFIDEGYYSFAWMLSWGHWIVFCLYMIVFFAGQWLWCRIIFGGFTGWKKMALMTFIALPVSILFFFWSVM